MQRHLEDLWHVLQNEFEGSLQYTMENSGCDKFAIEHFRYSAADYIFDGEIKAFERNFRSVTGWILDTLSNRLSVASAVFLRIYLAAKHHRYS